MNQTKYWAAAFLAVFLILAAVGVASQGRTLKVTVTWAGEGEVNADHPIWVFLWDNAQFTNIPIGSSTLDANDKTADFDNVTASPVYISVAYDEQGGYSPFTAGPPPSGTPVGVYTDQSTPGPSPIQLKDGEATEVKVRFDASYRMP